MLSLKVGYIYLLYYVILFIGKSIKELCKHFQHFNANKQYYLKGSKTEL